MTSQLLHEMSVHDRQCTSERFNCFHSSDDHGRACCRSLGKFTCTSTFDRFARGNSGELPRASYTLLLSVCF
jgi:hypothetical protein